MLGPYFAIIMDIKVLKSCVRLTFKYSYIPMTVKHMASKRADKNYKNEDLSIFLYL